MAHPMAAAAMLKAASKALFDEEVQKIGQRLLDARSWIILEKEYPILDVLFTSESKGKLRIRLNCTDWNELPPSVAILNEDGQHYTAAPTEATNIFHAGPHQKTGLPFICMIGSLEYHTHESHIADHWESYRNKAEHDLGSLLTKIWKGWLNGAKY